MGLCRNDGGMGMKKHGQSGKPPKSPKAKYNQKIEAERQSIKAKKFNMVENFKDLF